MKWIFFVSISIWMMLTVTVQSEELEEVLLDHFEDIVLDSAWKVSLVNALDWTYDLINSKLVVTDIHPQVVYDDWDGSYARVCLVRRVDWYDDFEFDMDFDWEAEPEENHPLQVMYIELLDPTGERIFLAGYRDCWFYGMAGRWFGIGDLSIQYTYPNELPSSGNASINIVRTDGQITFKWNNEILLEGFEDSCANRLKLSFLFYPYHRDEIPGEIGTTSFGSFAIDRIRLEGICDDTDEDGLCDCWETVYDSWGSNGIDYDLDGEPDITLQGADPQHKDLYVEVDAMEGRNPILGALDDVEYVFSIVPNNLLNNPDGQPGINLHILRDTNDWDIPRVKWFNEADLWDDFHSVKDSSNMDYGLGTDDERTKDNWNEAVKPAKALVYHYCLFADQFRIIASDGSEEWTTSGFGELPGNDFAVTLGGWSLPGGNRKQQAGVFMHELGHNLNLRHGGGDDIVWKPNYTSVMNYTWQLPRYEYKDSWLLDYSRKKLATLNETSLDETAGIGGREGCKVPVGPPTPVEDPCLFYLVDENGPVDWNRDGDTTDIGVAADINHVISHPSFPSSPGETDLSGFCDWTALWYKLRGHANFDYGAISVIPPDPEITFTEFIETGGYRTGDTDGDHLITMTDFALFSKAWLSSPDDPDWNLACDWYQDENIDIEDLLIFSENWLKD